MASDTDSEFDLSLEDEQLLASLAENTTPTSDPADAFASSRDAAGSLHGSSQGRAALVGIARTNSVNAFVHRTQPQSTPSIVPADDIKYPDRRYSLSSGTIMATTILTDLQVSSHSSLEHLGANRSPPAARAPARCHL